MAHGMILGQTLTPDIPIGGIILWSGAQSEVPTNWHLCDGTNGTPDLRGQFVIGAGGSYAVGNSGGEAEHTLAIGEMPRHNHTASNTHKHTFTGTAHTHTTSTSTSGLTASSDGEHTHNITGYYKAYGGSTIGPSPIYTLSAMGGTNGLVISGEDVGVANSCPIPVQLVQHL